MKIFTIATVLGLASLASAEIFLHETFSDGENWTQRWTPSTHRADLGKLEVTTGKWFADENKSNALRTTEDYRFYATSTPIKPFTNKGKDLVIQYDVKNEQHIDCGGNYVKIFSDKFDPKTFNGDSEYNIMFGPDFCGTKAMVHAIFNYKGVNYDLKKTVSAPNDVDTHTYTLIVKPDQTYQILVDGEEKASGELIEDWDFLGPKTIKDPSASKPADWVDEHEIDDPEDKKPIDYDSIPEFLADPEAVKPEDWDDEMDGEWEAPSVPNPDFKGPWAAQRIPNPDYKGPWIHPEIDNPEYKVDNEIYAYTFGNLGLDLWQVKSGSLFDNFLVTDDIKEAEAIRQESLDLAVKEKEAKAVHEAELAKAQEEADAEQAAVGTEADDKPLEGGESGDMEINFDELNFDDEINLDEAAAEVKENVAEIKEEVEQKIIEAIPEAAKKPVKDEL
ncbi:Calreticulin CNE1 [Phycomyces blakesleeanus]|uniref:Calreticulin n=2 Tax=Phycomyces blakesleeanus TaxID=4837 RepID=A0A162XTK8_PHYB8|nr:Calreticulin CNE1 [Phycomyces blakesleeanus NRRL 1555(-)]OAD76435.1 Calreticulin CNE1 [Phycomyces blakesleeanus NRRL 1555(-)]|eukprot:XP_018294475.1 Calreticulin CNE1 [Phycomyces blakesleeanus NRRL 1555(-)]